jgi:ATP-dependent Clp protease ATP-binding subunit ClpC
MYGFLLLTALLVSLWIVARLGRKKTPLLRTPVFPRYTVSARRAISFARWHARQMGARVIQPEHLLLGLIQDQNTLARSFLVLDWDSWFENEIKRDSEFREALPEKTELPLADASKRILAYTTMEADSLSHQHIGTEHLILGILREKSAATNLLTQKGITLKKVRAVLQKWTPDKFSVH